MGSDETAMGGARAAFGPTLWTVVLTAKDPSSPHRRQALETLIEAYWKPLYSFIRRRGYDPESSKDLTQGFFTDLIEKNFLQYVNRGKGRFRTFLLTAFQHYAADESDRATALKRGGGSVRLSLDFEQAEAEGLFGGDLKETPDRVYLREWGLRVLAQAVEALRAEYESEKRTEEFESLKPLLTDADPAGPSYAELARRLRISESDVRNRIHRARVRLREAVLAVIRATTDGEADAREELRDLFSAFS